METFLGVGVPTTGVTFDRSGRLSMQVGILFGPDFTSFLVSFWSEFTDIFDLCSNNSIFELMLELDSSILQALSAINFGL